MEEIRPGDYVRTKKGRIYKVNTVWVTGKITCGHATFKTIQNIRFHSPNIIDLVEVGDYVNGKKIEQIIELPQIGKVLIYDTDYPIEMGLRYFTDKDIRDDIVTREQFESVKYHVGGKEE